MNSRFLLSAIAVLCSCPALFGQEAALVRPWRAFWIDVPGAPPQDYGVYHFRRSFQLQTVPSHFVIHVSGDNRYQLFANGHIVSAGPSRGDLTHWRYETVDIATHLQPGPNVLAAVVWNEGPRRAIAQVTNQTGFLLEADDPQNSVVDTGHNWQCLQDAAYNPQALPKDQATGYYALGPNESVDGSKYPWGWETLGYDAHFWEAAHEVSRAASRFGRDAPNPWMLVPSEIPLEERIPQSSAILRTATGLSQSTGFPNRPVTVQPHGTATLLLDQGYLTTAYPELAVSGGKGSTVDMRYAETLYVVKGQDKGNRNDVNGKAFYGPADTYLPDGGERVYRPLFWRTFRYVQFTVKTTDEPVTLGNFRSTFSGYPFQRSAELQTADRTANGEIQRILDTGWRTARLCAHETYMDCPAYEQLQYSGDARIQMMVSLYMTGDARLMKKGIALLNSSRTAEGATYSRAPSNLPQYIPPFSLWWIGMVHDYWMYVDDPEFVRSMLGGVRSVLGFYSGYQKRNGSLGRMPWWNFVDWVKDWSSGQPPSEADGSSSAILDLQLLMAYQWAADLESAFGLPALAAEDTAQAQKLKATILETDWDSSRGLFADQPSHQTYSQHANTLAVLAHVVTGDQARQVVDKIFADKTLTQSTIYFRAYTNATLREVGLGRHYSDQLGPWRHMLSDGLTTWAEWDGPDVRSDCHAWGASPNFEYFRTIAGIESGAPGFRSVIIRPDLGALHELTAKVPHPKGTILVHVKQDQAHVQAQITLPPATDGTFVWAGRSQALHQGENGLSF